MNSIKIGIVGIGNMGSAHAKSISDGNIKGMGLVAVCDINPAKIQWANDNLPNIQTYSDYSQMLDNAELDAVLIATPHYYHCDMAIAAFAKGLHVLTEKPAGVFTKQVEAMNAAAAQSGKVFGIMYNQRTNPIYRRAKEMVEQGLIGAPKRMIWIITNWYRTQSYYNSGSWRATWAGEGGGVLLNQCPHNLDLWQWIFGMPKTVTGNCGYGKYHDIEVEDDVTAYAEYKNGATAVFITTTGEFPGTNRLEITGDKGKLVIEDGKMKFWQLQTAEREFCYSSPDGFASIPSDYSEIVPDELETAHNGILQNFTNNIISGEPLISPGYDGIRGLAISNAIHLSSWTNKPVTLPIDQELYASMLKEKAKNSKPKEADDSKISNLQGTFNDRWEIHW